MNVMDIKRIVAIIIMSVLVLSLGLIYIFNREESPKKKYLKLEQQYCDLAVSLCEKYSEAANIDFEKVGAHKNLTFASISGLALLESKTLPLHVVNPLESDKKNVVYFSDTTRIRVLIKNDNKLECEGFVDVGNRPEISLVGGKKITISRGEEYRELGYNAVDLEDGDLTVNVIKNGIVDPNIANEYTLLYFVSDSDGNTVSEVRTVVVK